MADEAGQHAHDADWHRQSYVAIMKGAGEVVLPAILGAVVFFINLVLANGIPVAFVGGVITLLSARFIVRTFFSH